MLRRDLLRWLAAGAGLGCLDGLRPEEILPLGRHVHDAAGTAGQELRALDAHANATVIAAAERILPRTDTPGATDAAVNLFIDRMLADWHTATERDRVLAGLRELDARSQARHGSDFIACP